MTAGEGVPSREGASVTDATAELLAELRHRGWTLAVAESLTGGALAAELIRPAGASAVVVGAVVAYATELKRDVIGVDADLLAAHGPVHPEVAMQLADRIRAVLAVDGRAADAGLATTGVAGPDPQGGQEPGTVFVGVAVPGRVAAVPLRLSGDRDAIRAATVRAAVTALTEALDADPRPPE